MASVHRRFAVARRVDAELIARALCAPNCTVPFRELMADAQRVADRVEAASTAQRASALDLVEAGFFRDRRAFVVGRWLPRRRQRKPCHFVQLALQNGSDGIRRRCALLHRVSDIHNLFSSALANFHVTSPLYYQICVFLFSLMPRRPLGHQYSTIGFNHAGKVAILNEINEQIRLGHRFQRSPGAPGTVALGFTFDSCSYHLKVIRDRPTQQYKWGA